MKANEVSGSILIVDDEQTERQIINTVMSANFPRVKLLGVENGVEALRRIQNQKFDLLITDTDMPKMDGKTLLTELKNVPASFRPSNIILLLEDKMSEDPVRRVGKNVWFISKPLDPEVFIKCTKEIFGVKEPKAPSGEQKVVSEYLNVFIQSTLNVLSMMCSIEPKKKDVFIRKEEHISGDISALMTITSSKYQGSMAIAFDEPSYLEVLSNMLGEEFDKLNDEISDGIGELCNQIFGDAKVKLNEMGYDIQPARPSVIVGKQHQIQHKLTGPCFAVSFETTRGLFCVEAIVQPKNG